MGWERKIRDIRIIEILYDLYIRIILKRPTSANNDFVGPAGRLRLLCAHRLRLENCLKLGAYCLAQSQLAVPTDLSGPRIL